MACCGLHFMLGVWLVVSGKQQLLLVLTNALQTVHMCVANVAKPIIHHVVSVEMVNSHRAR